MSLYFNYYHRESAAELAKLFSELVNKTLEKNLASKT